MSSNKTKYRTSSIFAYFQRPKSNTSVDLPLTQGLSHRSHDPPAERPRKRRKLNHINERSVKRALRECPDGGKVARSETPPAESLFNLTPPFQVKSSYLPATVSRGRPSTTSTLTWQKAQLTRPDASKTTSHEPSRPAPSATEPFQRQSMPAVVIDLVSDEEDDTPKTLAAASIISVSLTAQQPEAASGPSVDAAEDDIDRSSITTTAASPQSTDQAVSPSVDSFTSNSSVSTVKDVLRPPVEKSAFLSSALNMHGMPFTAEEDQRILTLRDQGIKWKDMPDHFEGRTRGSLQVRHATKLKSLQRRRVQTQDPTLPATSTPASADDRSTLPISSSRVQIEQRSPRRLPWLVSSTKEPENSLEPSNDDDTGVPILPPPKVNSGSEEPQARDRPSRWTTVNTGRRRLRTAHSGADGTVESSAIVDTARVDSKSQKQPSTSQLLRHRELGQSAARRRISTLSLTHLKDRAVESLRPVKYMQGASGDVATLSWSPDGRSFSAGAVALSDPASLPYNRPKNLLLGDVNGVIRELPEHHLRPKNTSILASGQDPRVFTTVQQTAFSPGGTHMYSVSLDRRLNVYDTSYVDVTKAKLRYQVQHDAAVDLLSVSPDGLVATGMHRYNDGCINVMTCGETEAEVHHSFSARTASHGHKIFPSALKWGVTHQQSSYLLGGFAQERQALFVEDHDLDVFGDTCLWNVETGQRIKVQCQRRNVFDVAWNPTDGHTAFAVASVGDGRVNPGMHSVVRLYDHSTAGLRCQIELETPAFDINDVTYCPYDENLIAAGSTDGRVFLWDQRFTKSDQQPLRVLSHGRSLNVLPQGKRRWEVDTGVRFLSWGMTRTRLFSGSSDGVVRSWDPYVADEDSHIADVASFKSAIMSGAFSPDFSDLLIGEEQGQINLLSISGGDDGPLPESFKVIHAPEPVPVPTTKNHGPPSRPFRHGLHLDNIRLDQRDAFAGCGNMEISDSSKSVMRIPDQLRRPPLSGIQAFSTGMIVKCGSCGAAAHPNDDEHPGRPAHCVKCVFECFRCAKPMRVSGRRRRLTCEHCKLSWIAGSLGYELETRQPITLSDIREVERNLYGMRLRSEDLRRKDRQDLWEQHLRLSD